MVFRLADVKKTVRSRSDGERYLHPKLLEGTAAGAQIDLALGYLHSRLGRARREVDPEILVRFFGDATLARGLVACLSATYRWQTQSLADVLDAKDVARLATRGIHTASDLRLFLYDALNAQGDGFLGAEREEQLQPLARRLHLATAKLDQLVALDADENAVLVRVGTAPDPDQVLRLYNYSVVDAIVRNSQYITLHGIDGAASEQLAAACRDYDVDMERQGDGVRLRNRADAFGSYARWGLRLARALYSAGAARPSLLASGRAHVQLPGKAACYLIDRKTLHALTGGTGIIRCSEPWPECRADWDRCRSAGGTGGWRLVSMPEPGITAAGLALAPAACRLGDRTIILWRVASAAGLADLVALNQAGIDILGVVEDTVSGAVPGSLSCVPASGGARAIVDALRERWGGPREAPAAQALEGLLAEIDVRGFIPEEQVAAALGCISLDELPPRLLSLDPARGTYVQGVGLCTPAFVDAMRKGLRRKPRRVPAA